MSDLSAQVFLILADKYGMKVAIFVLMSLICFSSNSAEVDQFTKRYEPLPDVTVLINNKANVFLKEAVVTANSTINGCDEIQFYELLKNYFSNHKNGKLVQYILYDQSLPRRRLKVGESIYADFSVFDGYLLGKKSADESEVALGPLIKYGPRTVGSDKFEHLFGRGFVYFKNYYFKKRSMDKVLSSGEMGEKTIYGGNILATGVYSYADLVANFNGMRFWNDIFSKRPDVLNNQNGPYVKCVNDRFVKVKDIDFRVYFDDGVDEAINCVRLATKKAAAKVRKRVSSLYPEIKLEYVCPMEPAKLQPLIKKYGDLAPRLINQNGHAKRD